MDPHTRPRKSRTTIEIVVGAIVPNEDRPWTNIIVLVNYDSH